MELDISLDAEIVYTTVLVLCFLSGLDTVNHLLVSRYVQFPKKYRVGGTLV